MSQVYDDYMLMNIATLTLKVARVGDDDSASLFELVEGGCHFAIIDGGGWCSRENDDARPA